MISIVPLWMFDISSNIPSIWREYLWVEPFVRIMVSLMEGLMLIKKLLHQWFLVAKSPSRPGYPLRDICVINYHGYVSLAGIIIKSFLMVYHRICSNSTTTGDTCRKGNAYSSGAHEFNSGLCCSISSV